MALTFVGGLTLEARRKNIVLPVEDASLPAVVRLKLIDGCAPTVAAGDTVAEGERVAENADGFRILSPVCGEVTAADGGFVTVRSTRGGEPVGLPPVESPVISLSYEDVSERLKQAGVVGAMSGVPVYRKLARAKGKAKRIVINCLESDPYSAHISRLVTDNAEEIVNGAKILMHAVCVKRSVIAIEENRTEAIRALRNAVYDKTLVSTALFKPKYPAGNELLTVNAIYGREVRSGRTPEESGYLVLSAETLLNVFNAFAYGTPQTRKVVTVSGNAVSKKKILRVRNGTSADEIFGQLRRLRRAAGRGDRGRHYARTVRRAGRMRHPLDQRARRAAEEARSTSTGTASAAGAACASVRCTSRRSSWSPSRRTGRSRAVSPSGWTPASNAAAARTSV